MQELIKALNSDDETDRLYAVEDISETRSPEVAVHLAMKLNEEESQVVREAIVFALKRMGISMAADMLFDMFTSPDAYLRNAAVTIFGAGGEGALAYLTSRMDHSDKEVRKLILDSIVEIGSQDAKLAIRAYLHDDAPNVQITAVEYLARLGDAECIDDLIRLLGSSPDPMLKATILEAFLSMGDAASVKSVLSIMLPEGDIEDIPDLYIPQVIGLVAKAGDVKDFLRMIDSIDDISIYGDNIVKAIGEIIKRFGDVPECEHIVKELIAIIKNNEIDNETRFIAAEYLIGNDIKNTPPDVLSELGLLLVSEGNGMIYQGVKLLAKNGSKEARVKIEEIMKETEDDDLQELCNEIMTGEGIDL